MVFYSFALDAKISNDEDERSVVIDTASAAELAMLAGIIDKNPSQNGKSSWMCFSNDGQAVRW